MKEKTWINEVSDADELRYSSVRGEQGNTQKEVRDVERKSVMNNSLALESGL